jgi:uncharacterized protein YciI
MSSRKTFLMFRKPGPAWLPGVHTRKQPLWDEHAAFMDRLDEQNRIVLAGPYADLSRALVILEAQDMEEAVELLRDDPWVSAGILLPAEAVEWTIFMDSRRRDDESDVHARATGAAGR